MNVCIFILVWFDGLKSQWAEDRWQMHCLKLSLVIRMHTGVNESSYVPLSMLPI